MTVVNDLSGGDDAIAISNDSLGSSLSLLHVTAMATGGANNYGVLIDHAQSVAATLTHVTAEASGGTNSYGIKYIDSKVTLTNVTASASGRDTDYYGIFDSNQAGDHATIEFSVLSGNSGALLSVSDQAAFIASTRLDGGVTVRSGFASPTCAGVYDGNFTFYDLTCP